MDHAVQLEWIFLQYVTKDKGQAFMGLELFSQETFLPRLFFGKPKTLPPIVRDISTFPVNKARMVLQNPVTSAKDK